MTPREFYLLSERHRERERAEDWRFGVVASMCSAMWRKKALEPRDFFVSLRAGGGASAIAANGRGQQTPEQQFALFKHMLGGRIRVIES